MTETNLTFTKLLYCYNNLKKFRNQFDLISFGKHLGYLEAGLVTYGYLEIEMINNTSEVKREIIPAKKWWKRSKKETYEEAIIRMTQKMFKENDIKYE
jgi:hypothetical protein